jgi:pimeloyl-ACP methyl ester carboxylesterase
MEGATVTTGTLEANGTRIYHEVRGTGAPVLFVAGASGDAGHFERTAELLAGEFTVVTYDRRGNSRSPRPDGWVETDVREQVADAAALLEALELVPASIVGSSNGAVIALWLTLEHPEAVRSAIYHEPPLLAVLADPGPVERELRSLVEDGMAQGGPRAAMESFLRFAAGDPTFEALGAALRERMLGNAEVFFELELGRFEWAVPDDAALEAVAAPVAVLAGEGTDPFFVETCTWLARKLGVELRSIPGSHAPYLERPDEFVSAIRPILEQLSERPDARR